MNTVRDLAGDRLLVVLASVVIVELGYLLALALFTAPNEYDVVTYHLTRAVFWIQRESVGFVPGVADTRINEFPANAEILQGATMLLSRSSRWVALVQIAALLAAVAGIYGIATRIGLDRRAATFGALLFATLPVVALQAPSALNDLVVAALVVATAFFSLGRSRAEVVLAGLSVALLVGTKVTAALALPVLLALAVLVQRGRRLVALLTAGALGIALGSAWYVASWQREERALDTSRHEIGIDDGLLILARATRYLVETVELPGAPGRDAYIYLLAAAIVLVVGAVVGRTRVALAAALLTTLPLAVPRLEEAFHDAYFKTWRFLGPEKATEYGINRDSRVASSLQSWYGPAGLALAVVALVLVIRATRRRDLPAVAVVLAVAPLAFVAAIAISTVYNPFSGRFAMGGVALAAATWGVLRPRLALAVASVAVATTTMFLSFVNWAEKPSGVELLERPDRASIWTLPREWVQSIQPEVSVMIGLIDDRARPGSRIAVTRQKVVYPFAYVGYPRIENSLAYADSLGEATRRRADWAVLPVTTACAPGWRLELSSPPWAVYRHVPGAPCR